MAGELLEFQDGTVGIALNLEAKKCWGCSIGDGTNVQEGSSVRATGKNRSDSCRGSFRPRSEPLARPIDGKGEIQSNTNRLIESSAPGIISRRSVHEPLQTGILSIDSMIPIGRGQRELIIGDRQTGKNSYRRRHYS